MQLDSLLRSIKDHCSGVERVVVIANSSSAIHTRAYLRLLDEHGGGHIIDALAWDAPIPPPSKPRDPFWDKVRKAVPGPLGIELSRLLPTTGYVGFAVDDMVFFRPSNYTLAAAALEGMKAFVWSWRYGVSRPNAVRAGIDFWRGPAGYAWHVDGSLYRVSDYRAMLDRFYSEWREAKTPNDLEGTVAARANEWSAGLTHLGPLMATCMTWQVNQAHATLGVRRAPFAVVAETELDTLAQAYLDGKRVDNTALYADTSWTTRFQKRPGQTHVEACEEAAAFYASLIR